MKHKIFLADAQTDKTIFVVADDGAEKALPTPKHFTSLCDRGTRVLLEFPRDTVHLVALRLCGLKAT